MKITMFGFILLFFILVGCVAAEDNTSETLNAFNDDKLEMNLDDSVLSKSVETVKVTAAKKTKVILKADKVVMFYKNGTNFKVVLKDNKKKPINKAKIRVQVAGKTFEKLTNAHGILYVNLNLTSGNYNVITTFLGNSQYEKKSIQSTFVVKSTIKSDDMTKYYRNAKLFSSKFLDKKGKPLKKVEIKFKVNNKVYSVKTDNKGFAKVAVDLKPGSYIVTSINTKTGEKINKTVTIKNTLVTQDLVVNDNKTNKFNVRVLNDVGRPASNKLVTFTINNKIHMAKTNSQGIASLTLNLDIGTYTITTDYDWLCYKNKITVNKFIPAYVKKDDFTHSISIPNYINVSCDYVFHNSGYALRTGSDGIIKLIKKDIITVSVNNSNYLFSQTKIPNVNTNILGYQYYLVPFDGGVVKSDFKKENLNGEGIIIYNDGDFTRVEYRDVVDDNSFEVSLENGADHSQDIVYSDNGSIKAKVNYLTYKFDESGLKYNLAKFYNVYLDRYNNMGYADLTQNNTGIVRYTNGESIVFDKSLNSILSSISHEDVLFKFFINGFEEFSKLQTFDYEGGSIDENYRIFTNLSLFNESYCDLFNTNITPTMIVNGVSLDEEYSYIFNKDKCVDVL